MCRGFLYYSLGGRMLHYNLSIKVSPEEYKHFEVPKEVYTYVKQLENAVENSSEELKECLKILYPGRF